jgi:hypothetical protein
VKRRKVLKRNRPLSHGALQAFERRHPYPLGDLRAMAGAALLGRGSGKPRLASLIVPGFTRANTVIEIRTARQWRKLMGVPVPESLRKRAPKLFALVDAATAEELK